MTEVKDCSLLFLEIVSKPEYKNTICNTTKWEATQNYIPSSTKGLPGQNIWNGSLGSLQMLN